MPEQQPLRICVICLHKARSLQDNRERGKKRGKRQQAVAGGELEQVGGFLFFFILIRLQ